ncbi:PRA1 family protein G2-like [Camellia sinensis]|uniref:PRA1 family protein G2-like n=1 Tax=Camellia sinensis TaxID=4442 RepID=UPI001036DFA4|nr:PRA1 family protein G2-like [Camellia sinensis]
MLSPTTTTSAAAISSPSPVEDPISGDDVISRSIQNVSDTVSRHRPWSEFIAAGVFDSPESLSAAGLRLQKHSTYFSINYAILISICAAFSILLTPISLISYAAVFALSNGSHRSSLQWHVSESSASLGNPSPSATLQEPSRRRFGSSRSLALC